MSREKLKRITVRPASVADSAAISRVCLLTAYQGRSAEKFVQHPELPSQVRALPYLHLTSGFAFVLVETAEPGESQTESKSESEIETEVKVHQQQDDEEKVESNTNNVVGYVVGTGEAAKFSREVDAVWWPALRRKYPRNFVGTPLDRYFVDVIHKGNTRLGSEDAAHIHVNVIGKYKKYGYDRLLVDVAFQHLREEKRGYRFIYSSIAAPSYSSEYVLFADNL